MTQLFANKKQILASVLAVVIFLVFHFTNIFGLAINKLKGNSYTDQCIASISEDLQGAKFIFTLAGVPENKVDKAVDEMIVDSCTCIIDAAGSADINSFIIDKANSEAIKKCSEDATGKSVEKYAKN